MSNSQDFISDGERKRGGGVNRDELREAMEIDRIFPILDKNHTFREGGAVSP